MAIRYRFQEEIYKKYALALGQAALSWNWLHECLGHLFVFMYQQDSWGNPYWALWNSAGFDRPKRKLLDAAMRTMSEEKIRAFPQAVAEIKWLLDRVEALEEDRNNVVHSPLFYLYGRDPGSDKTTAKVQPVTVFDNPRAHKLSAKDVLTEFRYVRDSAQVLAQYANALRVAMIATITYMRMRFQSVGGHEQETHIRRCRNKGIAVYITWSQEAQEPPRSHDRGT